MSCSLGELLRIVYNKEEGAALEEALAKLQQLAGSRADVSSRDRHRESGPRQTNLEELEIRHTQEDASLGELDRQPVPWILSQPKEQPSSRFPAYFKPLHVGTTEGRLKPSKLPFLT